MPATKIDELRSKNGEFAKAAGDDTLRDGALVFGNFRDDDGKPFGGLDDAEFRRQIKAAVERFEYDDGAFTINPVEYFKSDLIWPDGREDYLTGTRYGEGDRRQEARPGERRDGVRGRQGGDLAQLRRLAEEAIGRRQSWIDNAASARERQRRDREVLAEKAPGAAGSGEREYGTAGAYSAQALGVHYSKERRRTLTTDHYGTGMKGKEAERLSGPDAEDLRQRL
jgi:hypothetical protein